MILYADIYILINAFCDWLALFSCGKLLSLRIRPARLVLGVTVLSFYAILNVFFRPSGVFAVLLDITVLCLGCVASYSISSMTQLFKTVAVFFISCVFIGGIAGWLGNVANGRLLIAFCITPIIYGIWLFVSDMSITNIRNKKINVEIDGTQLSGLADSGNLLCDPYSGLPVIIISSDANFPCADKVFFEIEVSTAAGNNTLRCFRPSKVTVGKTEVCAAAAVSENKFGQYDCIVPAQLI